MNDYLLEARDELKRLEHIIYVSLKYTRTVDVIIGALQRIIETYDLIIEAFMQRALEEELITSLPKSPALRAKRLGALYPKDKELEKYLTFYAFLKNILNSPHSRRREYRRHVTYVVPLEDSTAEVNIDNLVNCERFMHRFFTHAWNNIVGEPETDDE